MEKLKGLIAAPYTPMFEDGELNLSMIGLYADKLKQDGVKGVFICGTTGEGMLLSIDERMALAEEWIKEQTGGFKVIVHVGTTSYKQSIELAKHASSVGAYAIGCMGPTFLRPSNVDDLVRYCAQIAGVAPDLPFYYYHIPTVSEVWLPMPDFLKKASSQIPNLAGIKFTHLNMMEMLECLEMDSRKWDILHGFDEELECGLSMGAKAAIGSTYNYLAPLYRDLMIAFETGDIEKARSYQLKSVEFIKILIRYGGGVVGGKPIMKMVGIDCGPLRLPAYNLSVKQIEEYRKEILTTGILTISN